MRPRYDGLGASTQSKLKRVMAGRAALWSVRRRSDRCTGIYHRTSIDCCRPPAANSRDHPRRIRLTMKNRIRVNFVSIVQSFIATCNSDSRVILLIIGLIVYARYIYKYAVPTPVNTRFSPSTPFAQRPAA